MPSSTKSKIYFFYEKQVQLAGRTHLKKFIESLIKKEGYKLTRLNYIFCSDKRLLKINRQFLNHNYYTDIITFEFSGKSQPLEAEIYISIDRVKDNALALRESLNRELLRVIFHGALHLCGYSDKLPRQKAEMTKAEDYYLRKYLLT
jgi:rRNA maturation RNase YbeY